MRALLLSLALVAVAWTGCLGAQTEGATTAAAQLDLAGFTVPEGAELVEEAGATILRFAEVALPFEHTFAIPAGATIVRAKGTVADAVSVGVSLVNEETGRRRCNLDVLDSWGLTHRGESVCSGMAAIDPPGTSWVARVTAPALETDPVTGQVITPRLGLVDIVFETTPIDGLAAQLDLSQLSMPVHETLPTQYLTVPSFDGTSLWTEVTLPEGEGPWPTIIAASPYNGQSGRGDTPAMWTYFTHDWVKRGYAVVNVDVRGFGMSGGCVEIWSENEQKDQAFIVDWVAEQDWSDGNVGFYGQSYVGTTPVAAAVRAPDALKAIIAVAPVINAYYDWHFGGVPNGENTGSPAAYQVLTDMPPTEPMAYTDPLTIIQNAAKGVCDPTIAARANDPRAIYDDFYAERNFSASVQNVKAAVLYTQGFEDSNVKSAMIPWWFNEIDAPKLGLFGHWVHQHPTRADEEILFLGWMDQYVKGKPVGFERVGPVEVIVDDTAYRVADAWPPTDAVDLALQANLGDGTLAPEASGPDVRLMMLQGGGSLGVEPLAARQHVTLTHAFENDTAVAGIIRLAIAGELQGAGNAFFDARLYDDGPDGSKLMTYGQFNLAHRNGHDQYAPTHAGETSSFELPFLPTEHIFREGHTLRIVLSGVTATQPPGTPAVYLLHSGTGTQLLLPTIDASLYAVTPATATR